MKKSYKEAVKESALALKSIWGNLVQRTWHMAEQTYEIATKIGNEYAASLTQIMKDLARIIGNVTADTLWSYYEVIAKLKEAGLVNVYKKPHTGYTQVRAIIESGLPKPGAVELIQKCYSYDSKTTSKPYTVDAVKAMAARALGLTPAAKSKRTVSYKSMAIGAAALSNVLKRLGTSFPQVMGWKEYGGASKLVERLELGDSPLFE